jgi:hypothetical protein
MIFGDFSPPLLPSLPQQQDALKKGLGRAALWAHSGRLSESPLLEACLIDQRFDSQIESPRGNWLWGMIQGMGAIERFRAPILNAFCDLSDEQSASQLCQLAYRYAEAGDRTFRTRLYEIVEQKPYPLIPWVGEEEIVALDGEQGFLFAAGVRGRLLIGREWEWEDENLFDIGVKRLGEDHVIKLLNVPLDAAVKRFLEYRRLKEETKSENQAFAAYKSRIASTSVEEIFRAAESNNMGLWFRGWGKFAEEPALQSVLQHIWLEQNPKVIANLLKVFAARTLPEFDTRLIDLCRHGDQEVRQRAFAALAQNAHPLVRDFAQSELQKGIQNGSVVDLFVNNYRHGDENSILDAIELPDDENTLHGLLMYVIKFLEENPEADCSRLGVLGYASNPCCECRFHAARLLRNRHAIPDWITNECKYDSNEDCQSLLVDFNESTKANHTSP